MKRNAFLGAILLAACAAPAKNTLPEHELGTSTKGHGDMPANAKPAAALDPALPFRMAYANPGGMWMPMQMNLPAHAENFKNMGVPMSAEALTNPISEPLAAIVSL